jgi:hypothetical protein
MNRRSTISSSQSPQHQLCHTSCTPHLQTTTDKPPVAKPRLFLPIQHHHEMLRVDPVSHLAPQKVDPYPPHILPTLHNFEGLHRLCGPWRTFHYSRVLGRRGQASGLPTERKLGSEMRWGNGTHVGSRWAEAGISDETLVCRLVGMCAEAR